MLVIKRCFLLCCFLAVHLCALAVEQARPNILFFITDDESWLERSAYGWSTLPTPHFDRVARDGVLFTHAYTSAPSCAPSRAVCVTGRNFWELNQGAFIQAWLPQEFPVFPDILAQAGYHVGYTGKGWGPGVFPEGSHKKPTGTAYNNIKVKPDKRIPHISVIDYVENFKEFLAQKQASQPFYFWVGSTEPHGPYDKHNYQRLEKEFGFKLEDVSMPEFLEDTPQNRQKRANFLYEICYSDVQLGKVLEILEQAGELENTLVVVTSDNGTAIGDFGKASPYEWSCREPLAIMWPKSVPKGRTVDDFVAFRDFAPTFLDAAGIKVPAQMTGSSLLPILKSGKSGRVESQRDCIVHGLEWHGEFDPVSRSHRTYRNERYAYIVRYSNSLKPSDDMAPDAEITGEELYDLEKDPWQRTNLFANPEYASVLADLKAGLKAYALKTGDPRFTGKMKIFRETRDFVQERKRGGYKR